MSGYVFDWLSGTVRAGGTAPEAWQKEGLPAFYDDPADQAWAAFGGPLLHASVHLWQLFASGYLANLLAEEWDRLELFEDSGEIRPPNNGLRSYRGPAADHPFSAYELVECWARYWEVQVLGPSRLIRDEGITGVDPAALEVTVDDLGLPVYRPEAFDAAMLGGPEAHLYARPYRWMLEQAEGNGVFVAGVFPIILHHAFGGAQPVEVTVQAVGRARQSGPITELFAQPTWRVVRQNWQAYWQTVFSESVLPVLMGEALPPYASGFDIMQRSVLRVHPVYREYLDLLGGLQAQLSQWEREGSADPLAEATRRGAGDFYAHDPWRFLALPGLPVYLRLLGRHLPPPKVVFDNLEYGTRRPPGLRLREAQAGVSKVEETFASRSADLEARITRFRAAQKAQSLGLPADAFDTAVA